MGLAADFWDVCKACGVKRATTLLARCPRGSLGAGCVSAGGSDVNSATAITLVELVDGCKQAAAIADLVAKVQLVLQICLVIQIHEDDTSFLELKAFPVDSLDAMDCTGNDQACICRGPYQRYDDRAVKVRRGPKPARVRKDLNLTGDTALKAQLLRCATGEVADRLNERIELAHRASK